ncbi:MAG TPA: hypothetical protein VMV86_03790, partial [Methanosarcinales archaeon]|nr:hypothetical protein [Methanosarcinales archaeon]
SYVRRTRLGIDSRLFLYGIIVLIIVFTTTAGFLIFRGRDKAEVKNGTTAAMDLKKINVVRASRNIQAGEIADTIVFDVVAMPKEYVPTGAVESVQWLQNKRVSNAISDKEILLQSDLVDSGDWYDEGDRLMEHTFQDEAIPLTVVVGSIVDIKLFKPGNLDNVVIAKAIVIGKVDKTLSFYLNEMEQEYIKEANMEGQLFLVQYLDKSQQECAVTYLPIYTQGNKELGIKVESSFEKTNMSGGN